MAASPESIAEVRRQLADSRARLARTAAGLGASLNAPARLRQKVASHPLKWALLAAVGGVVVARTLPLAASLVRSAASRRLLGTVLTTLGPVALRAGIGALAAHRPDLAAFLHRDPEPPAAEESGGPA